MLTSRKRKIGIAFIILTLVITTVLPNTKVHGAAKGYVYSYNQIIEDNGFIYYIKSMNSGKDVIYQLDLSNNKKKVIVKNARGISNMFIENDLLYYVGLNTQGVTVTYSVSVSNGKQKKVCNGTLKYIDSKHFFYITCKNDAYYLYKYNRSTKKSLLVKKGNLTFDYIKSIGSTLYFYENTDNYSKLKIYEIEANNNKLTETTTMNFESPIPEDYAILVTDLLDMNGNLYYQYGNYQGSGNFWYGSLIEFNKTKKIQKILDNSLEDEHLYPVKDTIYYKSSNYKELKAYQTTTGKLSSNSLAQDDDCSVQIIGSYAYYGNVANHSYIRIERSSLVSDTTTKKNFIKFPYKQKSELSYSTCIKQVNSYYLVSVEVRDFSDTSYGWRGKFVGIKWYVANSKGKIIATFS